MIARSHGNKRLAARALGISYTTLKDKLRDAGEGEAEDSGEQAAIRTSQRSARPSASWPPPDPAPAGSENENEGVGEAALASDNGESSAGDPARGRTVDPGAADGRSSGAARERRGRTTGED
jgi:hypothetical protein